MAIHSRSHSAARPGFLTAWEQLVGARGIPAIPPRRGRKPRVPLRDLLPALTFHVMQGAGTLAEHSADLFADALADSSWADRRARLPWDLFADLMRRVLRPQATRRQREAFWRGWRLVALDGTHVQPDQHAADHGDGRESADAPGTCRVCQADHRGPVGSGPAQSARRRDWSPRRIGMGAGPAAAGAAAEASVVARRSVVWGGGLCDPRARRVHGCRQSLRAARPAIDSNRA